MINMLCEKCWNDAYIRMLTNPAKTQMDHYMDLLKEREYGVIFKPVKINKVI